MQQQHQKKGNEEVERLRRLRAVWRGAERVEKGACRSTLLPVRLERPASQQPRLPAQRAAGVIVEEGRELLGGLRVLAGLEGRLRALEIIALAHGEDA